MIDVHKTIARATEEMKRLQDKDIDIKLPVVKAVQLISNLQLALRHPGNAGPNAAQAREMCDALIFVIAHHSPDLADFCRLGFDKKYDR